VITEKLVIDTSMLVKGNSKRITTYRGIRLSKPTPAFIIIVCSNYIML
jgi:hypothetical protein